MKAKGNEDLLKRRKEIKLCQKYSYMYQLFSVSFFFKEHGYNDLKWEKTVLHENIEKNVSLTETITVLYENIEKNVSLFTLNLTSDGYLAAIRITSAVQTDIAM